MERSATFCRTFWTFSSGNGRLVYVGSDHTNDPDSLSIATIQTFWPRVKPDIAFDEGRAPPTTASEDEAIRKNGEAGLVRFLAARDGVPVASLDPTKSQLAQRLNPRFGPELVKTNDERDRFMIELLVRHVRQGKRVFAVVGATHVVRQEAALREAMK